jgi:hypothetical protein
MPKEKIPATPTDAPRPVDDEEHIAERVEEEDHPSEDEEEIEEGGLGPRG